MVMNLAGLAGLCIAAVVICRMLERWSGEYVPMTAMAVCGICIFCVLRAAQPLFSMISSLTERAGLDSAVYDIILKALGICILTQLAADICRDSRETAMASAVELAGRISLLLLCVPLVEKLLDSVEGLISL